jgi:Kef-type K+ transport system membrane component KefB/nucleotide-binding universal stress UspA family protein
MATSPQTTDAREPPVRPRRLIAIYVVMALAITTVAIGGITAGQELTPERSIAGGYDLDRPDPCLGAGFDLRQSGEFVNVENAEGTLGGRLRTEQGRLSGEVACAGGGTAELRAGLARGGLVGAVDGRPVRAELTRDPPQAGVPRPRAPDSIEGEYELLPRSPCLGAELAIEGSGSEVELLRDERAVGRARYEDGRLRGEVTCPEGGLTPIAGRAAARTIDLQVGGDQITAEKQREAGSLFAAFFIAVAVVMLVARLFGMAFARIGQPRVMGEVLAGISLGPTVLGALLPDVQTALFPSDVIPFIGVVAQLGLIFYMFLVGLEVDLSQIRGRVGQVAAISNVSVALPMMLGIAIALPIYELVGPGEKFIAFALFMGVSMSITAFPVLARILVERRMLKRPIGVLVLACAAVDDVTAWFLIALATAVAVAGSGADVLVTIGLAVVFCLVMGFAIRPLLARVSTAYDEAGRVPGGWVALIFAGVLLSAYVTEEIGIALIFGAFVMGLIMPRHAELTEDVTGRIEDFVVTLLLPLFFTYTGLRTNIGLLDRPELVLMTVALLLVAVVGKLFGAAIAARITGFDWRSSAVIGTLMNTRGLTELIVLNLALELGVISEALFAMLVLMAIVTTFMAGPALRLLDPRNELGAPLEEELEEARDRSVEEFPALPVPDESILVAPQSEGALAQLRSLAEPLARSDPPRELIFARLVQPPRGAAARGGLQTENRLLREASDQVNRARLDLIKDGVAARAVAFVSTDVGSDLARLARADEIALVLTDGRRPLLGEGVPRGDVGTVLREAPCDVAVLVAREGDDVLPGPEAGLVVPFGGVEHDWAALEIGAWIASATGAPLSLLGAAGNTEERARVSRLLGDAGLLVQQYGGITAQPVVAEAGREGVIEAASGAGLLVVGLSDRWREEGLGPTRSEIARAAPAPVLFVRRGTRPGALAPREDVTRFSWSAAGMGARFTPGGPLS